MIVAWHLGQAQRVRRLATPLAKGRADLAAGVDGCAPLQIRQSKIE